MIKIKTTTEQPTENSDLWSYPISELDYLLETRNDGESFLLYKGRLYEEGNDAYLQNVVKGEPMKYIKLVSISIYAIYIEKSEDGESWERREVTAMQLLDLLRSCFPKHFSEIRSAANGDRVTAELVFRLYGAGYIFEKSYSGGALPGQHLTLSEEEEEATYYCKDFCPIYHALEAYNERHSPRIVCPKEMCESVTKAYVLYMRSDIAKKRSGLNEEAHNLE